MKYLLLLLLVLILSSFTKKERVYKYSLEKAIHYESEDVHGYFLSMHDSSYFMSIYVKAIGSHISLVGDVTYSAGKYMVVSDTFIFKDAYNKTTSKAILRDNKLRFISGFCNIVDSQFVDKSMRYKGMFREMSELHSDISKSRDNCIVQQSDDIHDSITGNYIYGQKYKIVFIKNNRYKISLWGIKILEGTYQLSNNRLVLTALSGTQITGWVRGNDMLFFKGITRPNECLTFYKKYE